MKYRVKFIILAVERKMTSYINILAPVAFRGKNSELCVAHALIVMLFFSSTVHAASNFDSMPSGAADRSDIHQGKGMRLAGLLDAFKPKSLKELKKSGIQNYIKQLKNDKKASDRRKAAKSLKNYKEPAVIEALAQGLSDKDESVRMQCARSLWHLKKAASEAKPALKKALDDDSLRVRVMAAAALWAMNVKISEMVTALTPVLDAERLNDRVLAAKILVGHVDPAKLLPIILEVAEREVDTPAHKLETYYYDPENIVKRMARKDVRKAIDPLVSAIRQGHVGSRFLLRGLGHFSPPPKGWVGFLVSQLKAERPDVRVAALEEIAKLGRPFARKHDLTGIVKWLRPVIGSLKDNDEKVRVAAQRALQPVGAFPAEGFPQLAKMAIMEGQADLIREYVEMGVPLNQNVGRSGMTPLYLLFFSGKACKRNIRPTPKAIVDIVKLMLAKGADANLADDRGATPLIMAAQHCDGQVIRALINAGADVKAVNMGKMSAMEFTFFPTTMANAPDDVNTDAANALIKAGFRFDRDKYRKLMKMYSDKPAVMKLIKRAAPAG